MKPKIFVIVDTQNNEVRFRVVCPNKGISPIYILERQNTRIDGNPYLVYGEQVQQWTGLNKYNTTIAVARISSGDLE